ncbi:MAG: diacylglycerol kinase family protein [Bacteroidetes bacterium]|nr:diacylglycerol kinase family protein [Bacteroidota bacterium]
MVALKEQQNLRIHFVAIILVVITGAYLGLSTAEWSVIILTIGFVIVAELFNTAIEYVVDLASPQNHPLAKKAKDVSAAAVLTSALIATIVAFSIFGNKIFNLLLTNL